MNLELRIFTSSKAPFKYEHVTGYLVCLFWINQPCITLPHAWIKGLPRHLIVLSNRDHLLIKERGNQVGCKESQDVPWGQHGLASCFCPKSSLPFSFSSHIAFSLSISQLLLSFFCYSFSPSSSLFFSCLFSSLQAQGWEESLAFSSWHAALTPLFLCSLFTPLWMVPLFISPQGTWFECAICLQRALQMVNTCSLRLPYKHPLENIFAESFVEVLIKYMGNKDE